MRMVELTEKDIKKTILEIKNLHLLHKDQDAFLILEDFVKALDLLNLESALGMEYKVIIAFIQTTIPIHFFYLLAGDIFSNAGEYPKSLEAYKLYHFWAQQVKSHESLKNIDSAIVYSYRSYNEFFLEDLINKTITCSSPSVMNDPFDSIATFWSKKENLDRLSNLRKNSDSYAKSFNYYRIRSFVANQTTYKADDRLLDNVKMWSHYADSHMGVCARYRLGKHFIKSERPYEVLEKECKYNVLRLHPMIYKPDFCLKDIKAIDTTELICRKHSLWSNENEVRLISYNPYSEDKWLAEPLKDSTIEEIIFGYRCTEKHKMTIYNIAKDIYPDIQFSEMYIDEEKSLYKMIKKRYQPHTIGENLPQILEEGNIIKHYNS